MRVSHKMQRGGAGLKSVILWIETLNNLDCSKKKYLQSLYIKEAEIQNVGQTLSKQKQELLLLHDAYSIAMHLYPSIHLLQFASVDMDDSSVISVHSSGCCNHCCWCQTALHLFGSHHLNVPFFCFFFLSQLPGIHPGCNKNVCVPLHGSTCRMRCLRWHIVSLLHRLSWQEIADR